MPHSSAIHDIRRQLLRCGTMCAVICVFLGAAHTGFAANKFWNGGTGNWNTSSNWDPAGVPVNGDDLFFPSLAAGAFKLTTNNIPAPARRFRSITFTDGSYNVRGNGIVVTNGLSSISGVGVNTVEIDVTLGANQTFVNNTPFFTISGDINLAGFNLTLDASDAGELIILSGAITGTGNLTKIGAGLLNLDGTVANTYAGALAANVGELRFAKNDGITAVTGVLRVGAGARVTWFNDEQVANGSDISVSSGATLDLNGRAETIGSLAATTATVDLGGGTLTLGGDVSVTGGTTTVLAPGTLSLGTVSRTITVNPGSTLAIPATLTGGSRSLGIGVVVYAGFTKEGAGTLTLSGANSYGGSTTVNAGRINANSDTAFGATFVLFSSPGVVTVNPGAFITLNSADIGNKSLVINAPSPSSVSASLTSSGVSSWSGVITLNTNAIFTTGGTLALSNSITGPGGLTLSSSTPAAVFRFAGTNGNDFDGDLLLRAGTLELAKAGGAGHVAVRNNLIIGDTGDNGSDKFVRYLAGVQMDGDITINCSSQLDLNNFSDNVGNVTMSGGTINTGTGTLTINTILTVLAELAPCDKNFINGRLAFGTLGPDSIHMPIGSLALGAPDLVINAVISSAPELRITGNSGRVFLNGANTFTSLLRMESTSNDLVVRLNNPNALGGTGGATILNGIQLELGGFNFAAEPITNINAGTVIRTIGNNFHTGPIVLNSDLLITNTAAITELAGAITGPGDLRKSGTGTLRFSGAGANTFGRMFVNQGLFEMNKNAGVTAANPLFVGDGVNSVTARNFQSSQTDEVTVNRNSLWDLNGNNDTITPLVLDDGGDVTTGAGTLSFGASGSITVTGGLLSFGDTISTISGNLNLGASGTRAISVVERPSVFLFSDPTELIISAVVSGSAPINKTGAGDLSLTGANTFTSNVTVSDGELLISNDTALGTTAGSTLLTGDALLGISGDITVAGESLTLNTTGQPADGAVHNTGGTNTWTGPISLTQTAVINVTTNTALIVTGVMNGNGGVTKTGVGRLEYAGTQINTYLGTTRVNEGSMVLSRTGGDDRSIPGALIVGDGIGESDADIVEVVGVEAQINNTADVTVNGSGLMRLSIPGGETIGSLAGDGHVQLNGTGLFTGGNNASTTFSGSISGTGGLAKAGAGTFTMEGLNTFSGNTTVQSGTLLVDGNNPNSPITVLAGATLGGNGSVGTLTVNNLGTLSPGASPGSLNSRNTILAAGSNFRVELSGPNAGSGYDQLSVFGTINLNGTQLTAAKSPGFAPTEGQVLTIISNDGADPIVGTFAGRPEGSIITLGQIDFQLSYFGGSGNDVTLTVANIGLRFASARVELGNGNGVIDPDECDHLFITLENETGATITGVSARLDSLTEEVAVTQGESAYQSIPALGFRTNATPFQIRVSPSFQCGSPVQLNLVITATGEGTFSVPVTLSSGSVGTTRNFASTSVPKAVISLQATNSIVQVTNNFRVAKVRVSAHVTHPSVGDLRLSLISPGGTIVNLSTNHGGTGNNYGTACNSRTTFDDAAAGRIATGTAPFVGEFTPDEPLSRFIGESSSGTWLLRVEDTVAGDDGAIQCWSLSLAESDCTGGGGVCESCTIVAGTLSPASPTMARRIFRDQIPSGCGNVKLCPGETTAISTPPYRYNTHTFTNSGPATCVTAILNVPCTETTNALISAAYLDTFDPNDLCSNYLGDGGREIVNGSGAYSFRVPAGARFVVMVHELNPAATSEGCGSYSLELFGLPCPPPVLEIARTETPNRVRLSWSTAYPGYVLRGRNNFNNIPPQIFTDGDFGFSDPLNIINGRYVLTNSVPGATRFYELVK